MQENIYVILSNPEKKNTLEFQKLWLNAIVKIYTQNINDIYT